MECNILIEAGKTERQYWKDFWNYRELFIILVWRDIAVRYKQSVIGVLWAIIKPLLTMVIFVFIFGKMAKLPSEGIPYPIFVFSAVLPWTFFSTSFSNASNSLIANVNLISKVYFPRIIMPAATIGVSLVDFVISFFILFVLMVIYGYLPDWHILFIPLFLLLAFFISFGSSLLISALNVKYRDFKFIIPFIVQIGLYITPVGFSTSIVPKKYLIFFYLNPMVAIIDGFRWAISKGQTLFNPIELSISCLVAFILVFSGISYFRKTEKTFADVI